MRRIGAFFVGLAKRLGYTIYANWREERWPQAAYICRLFDAGEVDAVFDVGANRGQYRDFLRNEVGYKGLIFSFEPIPELVAHLQESAREDPLWVICPFALGRQEGVLSINVTASRVFSSFLQPKQSAVSNLFEAHLPIVETCNVEIKTLDAEYSRLQALHWFRRPYLKMDTQGYDFEVLCGVNGHLQDFVALQTEAAVQHIYHDMVSYQEVIGWLQSRGYVLSGMYPVSVGHFPELIEFDCHMVRSDAVSELRSRAVGGL